jgi:hypothetical protein
MDPAFDNHPEPTGSDQIIGPAAPVSASTSGVEATAFAGFLASLKAVCFYPENNPARERLLTSFIAKLESEFSTPDGLVLQLRHGDVIFNSVQVLRSGEEDWDLMARLFEAGLRDLNFLPGLSRQEVENLLKLLARTVRGELNPTDEDLSVLLWEMDLPAIAYEVMDPGEDAALFNLVGAGGDHETRGGIDDGGWEGMHPLGRYLASAGGLDNVDIDSRVLQVEAAELTRLRNAAKQEHQRLQPKLVSILSELLLLDLSRLEFERLIGLMRDHTLALISQGQFSAFSRMARRLGELAPQLDKEQSADLASLAQYFSSVDAARRALKALMDGYCDDEQAAIDFFGAMEFAGQKLLMDAVIPEHGVKLSSSVNALIMQALSRTVANDLELILSGVNEFREEHFTLLAQLLPTNLSPPQAEQISRQVRGLLSMAKPGVRVGVLQILSAAGTPGLERILQTSLEDEDSRVRLTAAELYCSSFTVKALQPLLQILLTDEFEKRDFDEQAYFYEAMAKSSPTEVFPFLEKTICRRNWFAPPKWRIQKACALRALGMIPIEKSGPLLLKHRKSRDPFLAAASRAALERHRLKLHGSLDAKKWAV